jgi:hypothetical protein
LVLNLAPCPPSFFGAVSAFHLPPPLSMFDYSLLFIIQFCWVGDKSSQRLC